MLPLDAYHPALTFEFRSDIGSRNHFTTWRPNFKRADYTGIGNYLGSVDWDYCLNNFSVDDAVDFMYKNIYRSIELYVPMTKVFSSSFLRWMSKELIDFTRQKRSAHRKWLSTNTI